MFDFRGSTSFIFNMQRSVSDFSKLEKAKSLQMITPDEEKDNWRQC